MYSYEYIKIFKNRKGTEIRKNFTTNQFKIIWHIIHLSKKDMLLIIEKTEKFGIIKN